MTGSLIVINPNSSETVTQGIDAAVEPLRRFGVPIRCLTLAEGPPGIESQLQADLESAVMTALTLGQRFGVIAILPGSIPRHLRAFGSMGVLDRLAGDRALGLGVGDLADPGKSLAAMIATGKRLRDEDGADVLIMGCAGMAQYRATLEAETGLAVVEPCQAAAATALGRIALRQSHRRVET